MRVPYATFRTREAAIAGLEEFFATGEICEGERPLIVRELARLAGAERARWIITLEEYA